MSEPSNMHKVTPVFFCPKCQWGSVHNFFWVKHVDPLIQDLVKALQELVSWQNGPPLPTPEYEHGWHQAMHLAAVALARAKERGYEYGG